MNRRGFVGSIIGALAGIAARLRRAPVSSDVRVACDPDSTLKYFAMSIAVSASCPRDTAHFINIGSFPPDMPVTDVYGERGATVTGLSTVTVEMAR